MADPSDLVRAWQDALRQLRGVSAPVFDSELGRQLLGPLQRQAEVVEQVVRRQAEVERELVQRVMTPAQVLADALEEAPRALRAQAAAFEAASVSFKQAADLLEVQAGLLETANATLRAPSDLLRSVDVRQRAKKGGGAKRGKAAGDG